MGSPYQAPTQIGPRSSDAESAALTGKLKRWKIVGRLGLLLMIGAILIGVLLTVFAMLSAFETLKGGSTSTSSQELAQNINNALYSTMIGLMVAVPTFIVWITAMIRQRTLRRQRDALAPRDGSASEAQPVAR